MFWAVHADLEPASLCVDPRCGAIVYLGSLSSCATCVSARTQAGCANMPLLTRRFPENSASKFLQVCVCDVFPRTLRVSSCKSVCVCVCVCARARA